MGWAGEGDPGLTAPRLLANLGSLPSHRCAVLAGNAIDVKFGLAT